MVIHTVGPESVTQLVAKAVEKRVTVARLSIQQDLAGVGGVDSQTNEVLKKMVYGQKNRSPISKLKTNIPYVNTKSSVWPYE